MKNTKVEDKKIKTKIKFDWLGLFFLAVVVYFVISFCYQQTELNYYMSQKEIHEKNIREQEQILKKYNEEKKVENTDEVMEKYARDIGYVKPYEKIFIDINK